MWNRYISKWRDPKSLTGSEWIWTHFFSACRKRLHSYPHDHLNYANWWESYNGVVFRFRFSIYNRQVCTPVTRMGRRNPFRIRHDHFPTGIYRWSNRKWQSLLRFYIPTLIAETSQIWVIHTQDGWAGYECFETSATRWSPISAACNTISISKVFAWVVCVGRIWQSWIYGVCRRSRWNPVSKRFWRADAIPQWTPTFCAQCMQNTNFWNEPRNKIHSAHLICCGSTSDRTTSRTRATANSASICRRNSTISELRIARRDGSRPRKPFPTFFARTWCGWTATSFWAPLSQSCHGVRPISRLWRNISNPTWWGRTKRTCTLWCWIPTGRTVTLSKCTTWRTKGSRDGTRKYRDWNVPSRARTYHL